MSDSIFSKLNDATGSFGAANYIRAGRYVMRVKEVKSVERRNGGGFGVVVEMEVLKVIAVPGEMANGPAHYVGEITTDFIDLGKDYGPNAFCSFIAACFKPQIPGLTAADVKAEDGDLACSPKQPCAGLILEVNGVEQTSQKNQVYARISYDRVVSPADLMASMSEEELANVAKLGITLEPVVAPAAGPADA